MAGGAVLCAGAEMPFARHERRIAQVVQPVGQGDDVVRQVPFVPGFADLIGRQHLRHVAEAGEVVVGARQQH